MTYGRGDDGPVILVKCPGLVPGEFSKLFGAEFLLPYPPCLSITNYVFTGKAHFYVKITDSLISIFPKSRSATLPAIRRRAIYGMMKTGFSFVLLPSCLVLLAAL